MKNSSSHPFLEIIRFLIIALVIVIPIRIFIAQPFIVSGASMEDTFHNNDYLIIDQLSYRLEEPERGDVVIFRYPRDPQKFFIKRVIGVPGDTLTILGDKIILRTPDNPDGTTLKEPYVSQMTPQSALEVTLEDKEYFVLGDNRDASSDSRAWGVLEEKYIVGRAFLRLYPVSDISIFPGVYNITDQGVIKK